MRRPFLMTVAALSLLACSKQEAEAPVPRGELRPYVTARDRGAPSPSWLDNVSSWFVGEHHPAPRARSARR
jgi:hypothetical protein